MDTDSITKAGAIFILYLFIMIVTYFILSGPIAVIFDGLDDADFGDANDEMNLYLPNIQLGLNIAFAIGLAIPITWFIAWAFHREPAYYQRRLR